MKNFFISLFFTKAHSKKIPHDPSILVVSTTGLGDTLWALPALCALNAHYQKSKISLLTTTMGKELLTEHPSVDQIFVFQKNYFSLYMLLRKKFDLIFLFHASQRMIFPLCRLLQPKKLIGTKGQNKGLDHLFTDIVPWRKKHEVMRRIAQIKTLGIKAEKLDHRIFLKEEEKKEGKKYLESFGFISPVIALHPGAKDSFKCWPLSFFLTLAHMLQKEGFSPLFTRGENDPSIPKKFPSLEPLPIRKFASVLSHIDLLVTNDTGPMHLASSLDIPTLCLFSPTDPEICGPLSKKAHLIKKERSCISCLKRKCQEPFCLMQISPKETLESVKKILL